MASYRQLIIICMILSSFIALGTEACYSINDRKGPDYIEFGAIPSGSAALVYVAQDQGFFINEQIIVDIKDYSTGVETTDALIAGDVDIAWSAEFPMVSRAFSKEAISILAVSSRFSDQYLFGLKKHGINMVSDLNGKTIGLPLNTIGEFYLARFLELNGMDIKELCLIDVLPPDSVMIMEDGGVDGILTWEPYTSTIKKQMDGQVVYWPVQSSQAGFGIMIGRNGWLRDNTALVERFLRALVRAEEYMIYNTEEAKEIVQKRVDYDSSFLEIFWTENHFYISLDQSLIVAMEDEARWMINSDLTKEQKVPYFLDYIYEEPLKNVKPDAVNIIRRQTENENK